MRACDSRPDMCSRHNRKGVVMRSFADGAQMLQLSEVNAASSTHDDDQRAEWFAQTTFVLQPLYHAAVHCGQRRCTR